MQASAIGIEDCDFGLLERENKAAAAACTGIDRNNNIDSVKECVGVDMDLLPPLSPPGDDCIAVVGMSCRFPGANNPDEFWNMLAEGQDGIRPFPVERLSAREKAEAAAAGPGAAYDGGFLKCPMDEFDARFFGMSPREAVFVDPQQRILLEVAWEALENAGINPLRLKGSSTSVYVGIHMQDYEKIIKPVGAQEHHHAYLGNCFSATASRLSYFLGLLGPNVAVESGCASSMVAVHLACESLKRRECSVSLASGVNLLLRRNEKAGATLMAVLSTDSRCKTFDASANGFARAEGVGTLVLKRYSEAMRDGDNVLALIRGTAVVNDGPGASFGTPSPASQVRVIREALQAARLGPEDVSYVEAHGTGTPVGDPLEFQGIATAYGAVPSARNQPLLIGSVKTNIGHTESAAGIAGIIKVILCMRHGAIPPHLHLQKLNPAIDLYRIPAQIPTKVTEWKLAAVSGTGHASCGRVAGVSSFSMSGTSTHAIIQEAPRPAPAPSPISQQKPETAEQHLVTISAKSPASLEAIIAKYVDYLETHPDTSLEDFAFTLNQARANFAYRIALSVSSIEELCVVLHAGAYTVTHVQAPSTGHKIGFLFTGQGSQYFGMGRSLYEASAPFRVALDRVAVLFESSPHLRAHGASLYDVLWHREELLTETIYCQPAIFCIEYALAQHWTALNLRPDFVLGHSIGEFSAAVTAGLLSLEDAFKLVLERSRLVQTLPHGRMLVLKASRQTVTELLQKFAAHSQSLENIDNAVDIAAVNSPTEVVVSGPEPAVAAFEDFCTREGAGVKVIKLVASHAFHSRQMDPVLDEFGRICTAPSVTYRQMYDHITYISGTYAKVMTTEDFTTGGTGSGSCCYWTDHLRQPVNFADAVVAMAKAGANVFLETGPAPVLLGLAMSNVDYSAGNLFCASMNPKQSRQPGHDDWSLCLVTLSKFYNAGGSFDLAGLYPPAAPRRRRLQLPTYAFERQSFWFVDEDEACPEQDIYAHSSSHAVAPLHPILGRQLRTPFPEQLYANKLSVRRLAYLSHHKVCGHVILPGAAFLDAALAVGRNILGGGTAGNSPLVVQDLRIAAALALDSPVLLQTTVKVVQVQKQGNSSGSGVQYEIYFRRPTHGGHGGDAWKQHATARFTPCVSVPAEQPIDVPGLQAALQYKNEDKLTGLYKKLAAAGLQFGSKFQSIISAWTNGTEIMAQISLPTDEASPHASAAYVCHPIVLDAMIQAFAFGFALNNEEAGGDDTKKALRLPLAIGKFVWLGKPLASKATGTLYVYAKSNAGVGGDISLHDESGACLATMFGLELVSVRADSFERNLVADRTPLPPFFGKTWEAIKPNVEAEVPQLLDQNSNAVHRDVKKILLLLNVGCSTCDGDSPQVDDALLDKLAASLAEMRTVVIAEHSGEAKKLLKLKKTQEHEQEHAYAADFTNASHFEDLAALVREVAFETGEGRKQFEGVILLCGDGGAENVGVDVEQASKISCSAILNLCRTFFQQEKADASVAEAEGRLKLLVVTRGALSHPWPSGDDAPGAPHNAPVWGLMKNFFSEFQLVDAKLIDVCAKKAEIGTPSVSETVDQLLFNLWSPCPYDEKLLAIRRGTTYTERLCKLQMQKGSVGVGVAAVPAVDRYTVVVPSTGSVTDLSVSPCSAKSLGGGGYVEVAVRAVGLNFHDLMNILKPEGFDDADDCIGMDFSGVVVATGSSSGGNAGRWVVGDAVIGITSHALQSHVVIHESCLMPKPSYMTFSGASTIPCVYMTSYYALVELCKISATDRVLIHVGSGGVGLSAIQLATRAGASVYTTAGTSRKREYLRSVLGLAHVYNSRNTDYGQQIMRDTNGAGVTVVLNSLTGPRFKETTLGVCAAGASFVEIGKINTWTVEEVRALRPDVKYSIVDLYPMILRGADDPTIVGYMRTFMGMLEDGAIRPLPRTAFALERIRDAFRFFQKAKHIGKVVVKMPSPKLEPATGKFSQAHELFDAEATYLITGGTGAIGLEVTKWMASVGAKHVVLVGRRPPSPQVTQALDGLRAASGCSVYTWQADLGDYDACAAVLDRIRNSGELSLPPLRGIFLASGVISDATLPNQDWEKFQVTFRSKVHPAWNFHRLTTQKHGPGYDYDLDFFTMFSSIVSSIGSAGQANYSAASAFLDSLTQYRLASGLPGATINWGPWSDIGQASNTRLGQEGMFGYRSFTPAQGIRALEAFLQENMTEATIMDISDWGLARATLNNGNLFENVMAAASEAASCTEDRDSTGNGARLWKLVEDSANDNEQQLNLEEYLRYAIRSILKLRESDSIDRDQELSELGVDSLTAMELRNHLQKLLGPKILTANAVQENRSVKKLAVHLASLLNTGTAPGGGDNKSLTELVMSDCILPAEIAAAASSADTLPPVPKSELMTLFMTGATGFLGAHIAHEILTMTKIRIVCLIRAESTEQALERLMHTFGIYGLPPLGDKDVAGRVSAVLGDITQPCLGLSPDQYNSLALNADAIVHCAAKLHLLELYAVSDRASSLRTVNVVGLSHVLRLAVARKLKHIFHPSYLTVATEITNDGRLPERFCTTTDYSPRLRNGYIVSKFVQEVLLSQVAALGAPCTVLRIAGLWGNEASSAAYKHTFTHVGSFLRACISFRKFPGFIFEKCGIPLMLVDAAAATMVALIQSPANTELGVYNYINNLDRQNLITQGCLEELMAEAGLKCEFMEIKAWRDMLFNEKHDKSNALLPFKYLYEDGEKGLRLFEVHPLIREDQQVTVQFDEDFSSKLKKNLPELPLAQLTAKEILKNHFDDVLK